MKLSTRLLIQNTIFLGPDLDKINNFNNDRLFLLEKKKKTIFDVQKIIMDYRTILPLVELIAENKGTVFVEDGFIHPSYFTNFKVLSGGDPLPTFAVFFNKNKKNIESCKHLGLPTLQISNEFPRKKKRQPTYLIQSNSFGTAERFQIELIKYSIKRGEINSLQQFSTRKFPRLGSNQRPRV